MNSKAAKQVCDCTPILWQRMLIEFGCKNPDKARKRVVILVDQRKPYPTCLHYVYNVYSLAKNAAISDEFRDGIGFRFRMRWPPYCACEHVSAAGFMNSHLLRKLP